jgi:tRNA-intron endonuclease
MEEKRNFWISYCAYKNLRSRGYIVKTALKFGAEFRVYDKGIKPGEDHAKWIVFPVHESETLTWYDFSAKNRVSHSTRKNLLIAVVDDEDDVTYYEVKWVKP